MPPALSGHQLYISLACILVSSNLAGSLTLIFAFTLNWSHYFFQPVVIINLLSHQKCLHFEGLYIFRTFFFFFCILEANLIDIHVVSDTVGDKDMYIERERVRVTYTKNKMIVLLI